MRSEHTLSWLPTHAGTLASILLFALAQSMWATATLQAGQPASTRTPPVPSVAAPQTSSGSGSAGSSGFVRFDSGYSYEMLDSTTKINRKLLLILSHKRFTCSAVHSASVISRHSGPAT